MTISKKTSKDPKKIKTPAKSDTCEFPIVGIAASAGGLEASEQFFENMPKDCGMAFVVIQHLDPTHIGVIPELLQRITPMKVPAMLKGKWINVQHFTSTCRNDLMI
jgi:two-component system, chemotaxis family, CheB/CheR fusion protein